MTIVYILAGMVAGFVLAYIYLHKELAFSRRQTIEAQAALKAEQTHAEAAMKQQARALRAEFKAISAEMIRTEGESLRTQHIHSLEALLRPLGRDIEGFKTQFVQGHSSLDGYIKALVEQTSALGREADNLAKALKGNTKLQGNWGEAVLANLLDASGLTEGRDYTLQTHLTDDKGKVLIPDVIVNLPANRKVIIDSKVSLKAYTEYVASDNTVEQEKLLKEHLHSVRQHIRELSEKDYARSVPESIGYVLMFIPGEAAYVAAVSADASLPADAYRHKVILINPSNLLMALQLAFNLWQSELQSRSVRDIYNSAEKLYKKFTLFAQNFAKIGNNIGQLQRTYDEAYKQLATGRGNIVSQLEGWKQKGLTTTANMPEQLVSEGDETGE